MISWQLAPFSELSNYQVYDLLKLRSDVFVVEQSCVYPDLDCKDVHRDVFHLLGYKENALVAYSRLLGPGLSYPSVSIGRVATTVTVRGGGVGRELICQSLIGCEKMWPALNIEIGAQAYLEAFYVSYGFVRKSENYLEDGIPHLDMMLDKSP